MWAGSLPFIDLFNERVIMCRSSAGDFEMLLVLCLDIATQPWIFSFVGALRNDQSYVRVL